MEELLLHSMTLEIQPYARFGDPTLRTDTANGLVRWFDLVYNTSSACTDVYLACLTSRILYPSVQHCPLFRNNI